MSVYTKKRKKKLPALVHSILFYILLLSLMEPQAIALEILRTKEREPYGENFLKKNQNPQEKRRFLKQGGHCWQFAQPSKYFLLFQKTQEKSKKCFKNKGVIVDNLLNSPYIFPGVPEDS